MQWFGTDHVHTAMVLDLLGPSLEYAPLATDHYSGILHLLLLNNVKEGLISAQHSNPNTLVTRVFTTNFANRSQSAM